MLSRRFLIAVALAGSALAGGHVSARIGDRWHPDDDPLHDRRAHRGRRYQCPYFDHHLCRRHQPHAEREPDGRQHHQYKVGDNVEVGVEDTRTFVLSSPSVQTPAPGAASVAGAMETSQGGVDGARLSMSIGNWTVVSVNPGGNTITLVNPGGGEVRTYDVTTDARPPATAAGKAGRQPDPDSTAGWSWPRSRPSRKDTRGFLGCPAPAPPLIGI